MMRPSLLVLALAALAPALALAAPHPDGVKYTDRYDNVNIDEILSNERLYKKYFECITAADDSHCTTDGKELRKAIPDALTNGCAKCTAKQKAGTEKVIKHLRANKSSDWEKLQAKWDPEGVYLKQYADKLPA